MHVPSPRNRRLVAAGLAVAPATPEEAIEGFGIARPWCLRSTCKTGLPALATLGIDAVALPRQTPRLARISTDKGAGTGAESSTIRGLGVACAGAYPAFPMDRRFRAVSPLARCNAAQRGFRELR